MDKKLLYESPTIDVITLQAQGIICQSLKNAVIDNAILDDWGEL